MAQSLLLQNVKLLAYERSERPEEWAELLAGVLGTTSTEAARVLEQAAPLTVNHVERIAAWSGRSPTELAHTNLLEEREQPWVFHENVRYLVRTDPRSQKDLAASLGVSEVTVSRWMTHRNVPPLTLTPRLGMVFGVPKPDLLKSIPFFLLDEPISVNQRRRWLRERIDTVPEGTLQRHFASIRKLLEDD